MKYDIETITKRKNRAEKIKYVLDILLVILIYNILLVSISCMNKIDEFSLLGYQAYIITTNSMSPTINSGDVIIIKSAKEDDIKKGDVITFSKETEVITHRVVNISENALKEKQYTTKGDNNNLEDEQTICSEDIKGKLTIVIPYLGRIINILENKIVFLIMMLMVLILCLYKINTQEKKENRREKKKIEEENSRK